MLPRLRKTDCWQQLNSMLCRTKKQNRLLELLKKLLTSKVQCLAMARLQLLSLMFLIPKPKLKSSWKPYGCCAVNCCQRSSVAQVRDCGVRTYQTTPTCKRVATLQICSETLIGATLCQWLPFINIKNLKYERITIQSMG